MSKKKRTTLTVIREPSMPPQLAGVVTGMTRLESLKQRMLRRVNPHQWGAMMDDVHKVVDAYVQANDRMDSRRVKLVV